MTPCSDEEYYYKLDNMVLGSNQILRNVFKRRWKAETNEDWIDDNEHVQKFINGVGQNAYKKALSYQKTAMKTKCLGDWDVSLLAAVLMNFADSKQYGTENSAIQTIKKMRNDLAHHTTKKIEKEEYDENVAAFKTSLQSIRVEDEDIQLLIDRSGLTSSLKALEYMKDLHSKADKLFQSGQVAEAIDCYSEAIKVPSLLPINLGTAHEKRAECFLKCIKDPIADKDKSEQAFLDSSKAIELNDSSWMAFYLSAQCLKWKNDLGKAILHYERALAISPSQKHVKNDLDSCKVFFCEYNRHEHLTPSEMPMNLQERVKLLESETGVCISTKEFINFKKMVGNVFEEDGEDHLFRGHQYFAGWDARMDFTEAVKHYREAAALKNPEAMHSLAMFYLHGKGVKQDVQEAFRILLEIAEMDPKTRGRTSKLGFNSAVCLAQHSIGLLYDEGTGVDMNHTEAASWYRRSMDLGAGHAANNLGRLYFLGKGIARDEKMAELCWKQAMNLHNHNASGGLYGYYINQMEPEKALNMVKIGREMGNVELQRISDEDVNRTVAKVKAYKQSMEPGLLEFEKVHQLETKGLTFRERVTRKNIQMNSSKVKMERVLDSFTKNRESRAGNVQSWTPQNLIEVKQKAMNGSETAARIMKTITCSLRLLRLLEEDLSTEIKKLEAVNLFYEYAVLEIYFPFLPQNKSRDKLKSIIASLFEEKGNEKEEDEMKIRFCYVVMNLNGSAKSDDNYDIALLKEGIKRYPDQANYYYTLACRLGLKNRFKESKFYAEEGLKEFPDHVDLLCAKAVHMDPNDFDIHEHIETCKEFLIRAPIDHRKVPDILYMISFLYIICHQRSEKSDRCGDTLKQVEHYFKLGQEAEKSQLSCYLPYGESNAKSLVELFLFQISTEKVVLVAEPKYLEIKPQYQRVLERKPYLKSPTRKALIINHRKYFKYYDMLTKLLRKNNMPIDQSTNPPKLNQCRAKKMSLVKPINLIEMNPTDDRIYDNRILELTIIDDPNPHYPSIHLVAEDENGDTTFLYIYNVAKNEEMLNKFRAGCRLAIINPYNMRKGIFTMNYGIRNDEPKCIIYLGKVENMCRFCGQENASRKCSKCKRPYCSRECQMLDWEEFKHKLICSVKY